jgi:hypothetical protein
MARKNANGGERREFHAGPGAQAAYACFPPPLGQPKYQTRNGKKVR